jgi:hypothetical protein
MSLFSSLLPTLGTLAGGFLGGPMGAGIGGALGAGIGGNSARRAANRASQQTQEQANQYFNNISGVGRQYYDPYIQPGINAANRADTEYGRLLDDPSGLINAIMESYKPSEGYKFKEKHLRQGAGNTAAAGGFAGTQYDVGNQSDMVNALLSDDMQQYLTNVLGVHGTGLAGKENVATRGFNASTGLADYLAGNMGNQAGLAFHGGQQRMGNNAGFNNSLLNAAGTLGGNIWTHLGQTMGGGNRTPQTQGGPVRGGYGGPRQPIYTANWMPR